MLSETKLTSTGGYHFGRMVDLSKYTGSHFESNHSDESNIIHKAIILSIYYNPDEIYNRNDGYFGNCWSVIINDSRMINNEYTYKLHFRNFSDLVKHYENQDMKFYP